MMVSRREDETSESELVIRARNSDPDAWEKLVDLHREAVFRLAYLHLGDADAAEDVAQETFIRAHRALRRFDAARPMRPWLLRIARNQCHNWRRSAGRYWGAVQRFALGTVANQPKTEELAERQWDSELLREAVQRLSSSERDVIYVRYFLDMSVKDAADALGVASGTIKSRTHRALISLRALLEEEYPLFEGVQAVADE